MPKPDALDIAVTVLLLVGLLVVGPVAAGRAVTPHAGADGAPLLLTGAVLQEQRFIDAARETLAVCEKTHGRLEDLPAPEQAFTASGEMQGWVEAADRAWTGWEALAPPGRFTALHAQVLDLVKLYRYLAGEAWTYYGDLDEAHLAEVRRGLVEAEEERARLEGLVEALDFREAPSGPSREGVKPGAVPTPTSILPEWSES